MKEQTDYVLAPQGIRTECCEAHQIATHAGGSLVWSDHSRYGGMWLPETGQWSTLGPFDKFADFTRWLERQGARLVELPGEENAH